MATVTSLYGLFVNCAEEQHEEYLEFVAAIRPILNSIAHEAHIGQYHGLIAKNIPLQRRGNKYLSVCLDNNSLFLAVCTRDGNSIHIEDHCDYALIRHLTVAFFKDVYYTVINLANLDPTKTPGYFADKVNDAWRKVIDHARSRRSEELKLLLRGYDPTTDVIAPMDYLFDDAVRYITELAKQPPSRLTHDERALLCKVQPFLKDNGIVIEDILQAQNSRTNADHDEHDER